MRYILAFLIFISVISCSSDNEDYIAIITGGHVYDSVNFVKAFKSYPDLQFDHFVHPCANNIYSSDSIDKYDALVFYDLYQDITDDQKVAFIDMLNEGKGVVFLHHSIASYQEWDEFLKILGGRYYLAPTIVDGDSVPASTYRDGQEVDVNILDKKHPVVKGLEDFHLHEEVYGQYQVIPDVHPLISSNHPESDEFQVWTNTYGKSRIVYIQFGHDNNAYSNPNFRKLLRQAIDWVGE